MPQLLWWGTLSPQGESNLAALRFEKPMRISSMRIFPKDAQPFKEIPDVVSQTLPDAFFLDVYFNAQYIGAGENKGPQRPPNALVPTRMAYVGSEMSFQVDMSSEYATRLMIVKGSYEAVSLAIYGEVAVPPPKDEDKDSAVVSAHYEPKALQVTEPFALSQAIDPANLPKPTQLAEQLLAIASEGVGLAFAARLIFCLKPPDEHWDDPDFPHLYADLENTDDDFDLESVVSSVKSRPVQDTVSTEAFTTLANRVNDFISSADSTQAYHFAELLSVCAPQHPNMARTLLEHVAMDAIFDTTTVDKEETIHWILDACTNRDIAMHILDDPTLFETFESLVLNEKVDADTRATSKRIVERVTGWKVFQRCLTNEEQDFTAAIKFLKDIFSEENSTGIWLSCMVLNSELLDAILRTDAATRSTPSPLFRDETVAISHEEFLTFMRALVGVLGVLTAWAWADSLPYDACRERALAIIHVWQAVEGYDSIVHHLLQLRQLTKRLGWIIGDKDPPRKSGLLAERVLAKLAEDPFMNMRPAFVETALDLQEPLYILSENDRLALRKNALVASDGLPAAVEEILYVSQRPYSTRRLRTLRISTAIIRKELGSEEGELSVLRRIWEDNAHGLLARFVELLVDIAEDLSRCFEVHTDKVEPSQVSLLFETAMDLLQFIQMVVGSYPLTTRSLHSLTSAIAGLFVCSDSASSSFGPDSQPGTLGGATRQACLDVLRILTGPGVVTETGCLTAQPVFRTLLVYAASTDEHDPVHKFLQIFAIVDHLLPYPHDEDMEVSEPSHWVTYVLPKCLSDLTAFFKLLNLDHRTHLFRRLVTLDAGMIGIGEWLLGEEMKQCLETLQELGQHGPTGEYSLILQHQILDSVEFILDIVKAESTLSTWFGSLMVSNAELAGSLGSVVNAILDGHYSALSISRFVQSLAKISADFEPDLRFSILLMILRNAQVDPTLPGTLESLLPILNNLPLDAIHAETFVLEVGVTLSSYAAHINSLDKDVADVLVKVLQWCLQREESTWHVLRGLKPADLESLYDSIVAADPEKEDAVAELRRKVAVDEDEIFSTAPVELTSERLQLPVESILNMLEPKEEIERPSTPAAGTKTPDILGTIMSPPTAVLRSPAATGLTKKYNNDDFRQLRQVPSARLNTSRLPSMHVDDFETVSSSPTLLPAADVVMGPPPTGFTLMPSPTMPFFGLQ